MITPNHPLWKRDLEDEVARLRSKILHLEEVNRSADQRAARTENRATQAEIQATQAESRANVLTVELRQCHDWIQRRDEHIRTLERQLRDVLPVSATQPDALSERDVVRKAEALNEEIYQLCALVCGTVIVSPDGEVDAVLAKSAKKARETIGTRLYEGARTAANWKVLTLKYLSKDDNARLLTTDEVIGALVPILRATIVGLTEELWHDVHFGVCSQELDLTLPKSGDLYVSAEMSVEEGEAVEGEKVVAGVALGVNVLGDHSRASRGTHIRRSGMLMLQRYGFM
ncbi:hypothetical protein EV715DRAFT_294032 [Schizophyllum commune]